MTQISGSTGWLTADDCRLDDLRSLVALRTNPADYPLADFVEENVLVYGPRLREHVTTTEGRQAAQAELARALADGPGIVVLSGAFPDTTVVDRATDAFRAMIAAEKAAGGASGDHFATPGANDRVWGALDKLAIRAPRVFADYYANDMVALAATAWLGPAYQITSQVNVVRPGGKAQVGHRDYHLGFMSAEQAARFPSHVHRLSQTLTLQGAVAHCDMPVETGPTLYLPHSQKFEAGYLAFHRPEFAEYFDANHVQLPLAKGDAVFFNPAVLHGAGTNRSADVERMANLLQISSAFGRAMETVDRAAITEALYPTLLELKAGGADEAAIHNIVGAAAEGYAFPTDLDRDQPVDGLAPETQAGLLLRALAANRDPATLHKELRAHAERRSA